MPSKTVPADIFGSTKAGWLHLTDSKAENKVYHKKFQPCWVLLWRAAHAGTSDTFNLLYYTAEDSDEAIGSTTLDKNAFEVTKPRKTNKTYSHSIQLNIPHESGTTREFVLAANNDEQLQDWHHTITNLFGDPDAETAASAEASSQGIQAASAAPDTVAPTVSSATETKEEKKARAAREKEASRLAKQHEKEQSKLTKEKEKEDARLAKEHAKREKAKTGKRRKDSSSRDPVLEPEHESESEAALGADSAPEPELTAPNPTPGARAEHESISTAAADGSGPEPEPDTGRLSIGRTEENTTDHGLAQVMVESIFELMDTNKSGYLIYESVSRMLGMAGKAMDEESYRELSVSCGSSPERGLDVHMLAAAYFMYGIGDVMVDFEAIMTKAGNSAQQHRTKLKNRHKKRLVQSPRKPLDLSKLSFEQLQDQKKLLEQKVAEWLMSIPIGGQEKRSYDPRPFTRFAESWNLYHLTADEIYEKYIMNTMAEAEVEMMLGSRGFSGSAATEPQEAATNVFSLTLQVNDLVLQEKRVYVHADDLDSLHTALRERLGLNDDVEIYVTVAPADTRLESISALPSTASVTIHVQARAEIDEEIVFDQAKSSNHLQNGARMIFEASYENEFKSAATQLKTALQYNRENRQAEKLLDLVKDDSRRTEARVEALFASNFEVATTQKEATKLASECMSMACELLEIHKITRDKQDARRAQTFFGCVMRLDPSQAEEAEQGQERARSAARSRRQRVAHGANQRRKSVVAGVQHRRKSLSAATLGAFIPTSTAAAHSSEKESKRRQQLANTPVGRLAAQFVHIDVEVVELYLKTVGGDEKKAALVLAKKFGTPKAKGEAAILLYKLMDVISAGIPADEVWGTADQMFGILGTLYSVSGLTERQWLLGQCETTAKAWHDRLASTEPSGSNGTGTTPRRTRRRAVTAGPVSSPRSADDSQECEEDAEDGSAMAGGTDYARRRRHGTTLNPDECRPLALDQGAGPQLLKLTPRAALAALQAEQGWNQRPPLVHLPELAEDDDESGGSAANSPRLSAGAASATDAPAALDIGQPSKRRQRKGTRAKGAVMAAPMEELGALDALQALQEEQGWAANSPERSAMPALAEGEDL